MWPSWVFGFFGPRNRLPGINGPKRGIGAPSEKRRQIKLGAYANVKI